MITSLSVGTGGLGRFGNMAFTIASCIGIAARSGQPFAFPRWRVHDNAGFGQPVDDIQDHLVNDLPLLPADIQFQPYGYFWGWRNIKLPTGNWSIDAHMQSDRFFSDFMPLIRHHLTFKNEPPQNDYVAIHYRAGDYIDDPNAYHPRQQAAYYAEAMAMFPTDTKYLLFSDDQQAALGVMPKGKSIIPVGGNTYIDDFKLMKRCHSFITANSSFSLMAAILGEHPDKKIVCPRRWFGPHVGLDTSDIYPEKSIVI